MFTIFPFIGPVSFIVYIDSLYRFDIATNIYRVDI